MTHNLTDIVMCTTGLMCHRMQSDAKIKKLTIMINPLTGATFSNAYVKNICSGDQQFNTKFEDTCDATPTSVTVNNGEMVNITEAFYDKMDSVLNVSKNG